MVAVNRWIVFVNDYLAKSGKKSDFLWSMEELQFVLYNFIPYMILILTHWSNATLNKKQDDEDNRMLKSEKMIPTENVDEDSSEEEHEREGTLIMNYVRESPKQSHSMSSKDKPAMMGSSGELRVMQLSKEVHLHSGNTSTRI